MYAQDSLRLTSHLTVNSGLRYQLQITPGSFANFTPRAGLAWALDRKSSWVFHLSAGLFFSSVGPAYAIEVKRLDGVRQRETTVYSPNFEGPLTPVAGSLSVNTLWQFPKTFAQLPALMVQVGVEHDFSHHWHAEADFDFGANWDQIREENINAPMVASTMGIAADPLRLFSHRDQSLPTKTSSL